MKKVLVGFHQPRLLEEITRYVNQTKSEELAFVVRNSKSSVLTAIADGVYDVVLLMEECGSEEWSMDDYIRIKDSYNITLIPIISRTYKGSKELANFCSYGITTAVFIEPNGVYKLDEIIRMIYSPRALKDARAYYGVNTVADVKAGGVVLDELLFEQLRNKIVQPDENKDIGERYLEAVSELTPAQVGDLIQRMDKATLNELKKTEAFYDVLDVLKQNKVIRSYRVPKEIKRQRRQHQREEMVVEEQAMQNDSVEEYQFENPVVIEVSAEDVREVPKYVSSSEEYGDQEDFGFSEEMKEQVLSGDTDLEGAMDEGDNEFGFSDDELGFTDDGVNSSVKEKEDMEFSFSDEMQEQQPQEERGKMNKKSELTRVEKKEAEERVSSKRLSDLDDGYDENEDVEDNKKKKKNLAIFIGIVIAVFIFLLIMAVLFIRISIQRKNAQALAVAQGQSGYDTLYNAEDVARYELTDNGGIVLSDEEGNVLYSSSQQSGNMEEELDVSIMTEEEMLELTGGVQQMYNDPSGFEHGKVYKGLDLVNMLNGTQGANCILRLKNGATVTISRGLASIEDFKPSAMYECTVTGTELYFDEQ